MTLTNGGEFTSKQFESHLCQQGIPHKLMVPYTSAQNSHTECTHCTIMDRARSICSDLGLPANLWGECVLTSTYMMNHTLLRSLKGKTPFKAYYGKKLNLSHLWDQVSGICTEARHQPENLLPVHWMYPHRLFTKLKGLPVLPLWIVENTHIMQHLFHWVSRHHTMPQYI